MKDPIGRLEATLRAHGQLAAHRLRRQSLSVALPLAERRSVEVAALRMAEADDVKAVQSGLLGMWLSVTGQRETRVAQEEAEVVAADVVLKEQRVQLEALREELMALDAAAPALEALAAERDEALAAAEQHLQEGPADGAGILARLLERQVLSVFIDELEEASDAGTEALTSIDAARASIGSLGSFGLNSHNSLGIRHPTDHELQQVVRAMLNARGKVERLAREVADVASLLPDDHQLDHSFLGVDTASFEGFMVTDGAVSAEFERLRETLSTQREQVVAQSRAIRAVRETLIGQAVDLDGESG